MDINDLEKVINVISSNYPIINLYLHFPIETYSTDYNHIFDFWEINYKNIKNNYQFLNKKIKTLESLKKPENNFINTINELSKKLNNKKRNKIINNILKILTMGIIDLNKKNETKSIILEQIKEIKQQNLVKINELILLINKKYIMKDINLKNNFSITNKCKSNL